MYTKIGDRPKIVIVDDDADFLVSMELMLKPLYRVTCVFGSEWTYAQISALEPDMVLLDVHMPSEGGFEICRQLRADRRFASTPIVFLSASKTDEDFRRHLRAGGTAFLNKQIDPKDLLAALAKELAIAGAGIAA